LSTLLHGSEVSHLDFSADGRRLLAASPGYATVWDVSTGRLLSRQTHLAYQLLDADISPDGDRLVTAALDTTARIWNVATGLELRHVIAERGMTRVAFSPDGRRVLTTTWDHLAQLWDAATGRLLFQLKYLEEIQRLVFSPDGRWILAACGNRTESRAGVRPAFGTW
jgi:WD40 repeat protein